MRPIVLSVEQRREVDRRRKNTLDRRIYERLTALWAVATGHTPEDTARLLGVDLVELHHWLGVFLDGGLEPLCTLAAGAPSLPGH